MWYILPIFFFSTVETWDYCVIGAGPGGIQLAYYLQKSGLDYVIIERNSIPGSFFEVYPRRRTLISINKRHTGETNTEFNMRHDWNSLLSDDPEMVFKHYSKEMFPPADTFLEYLQDYVEKFKIKIHYNTNIDQIVQDPSDSSFSLFTSKSDVYTCKYVVASTGISVLHKFKGSDDVEGYDTVSHDPHHYEGKKVLILGKGNSAFETADLIYGHTDFVHLLSRDRVKLSWNTHYVGDVRGVNNQLLDTYQLKSLDALVERDLDKQPIVFEKKGGKIFLRDSEKDMGRVQDEFLGPYDKVINCLGFDYDPSPFANLTKTRKGEVKEEKWSKYPNMGWDFQSATVKNLYYAGTITHGLDKRVSSGGFIHGFRYSSRTLAWILAARNHGIRWPSEKVPLYGIVSFMLKRMNEMNGPYQMFYVLVDVYLRRGNTIEVFKDVPHGLLHRIHELLAEPRDVSRDLVVVRLEYGAGYSQIGGDPFRLDRTELDPYRAHTCNFIHPVLYHFTKLPHAVPIRGKSLKGAARKLHLSEDLYTDFATLTRHWAPLSNFIGTIWKEDMSYVSSEECLYKHLTRERQSEQCRNPTVVVTTTKLAQRDAIRKATNLTKAEFRLCDLLSQ